MTKIKIKKVLRILAVLYGIFAAVLLGERILAFILVPTWEDAAIILALFISCRTIMDYAAGKNNGKLY